MENIFNNFQHHRYHVFFNVEVFASAIEKKMKQQIPSIRLLFSRLSQYTV